MGSVMKPPSPLTPTPRGGLAGRRVGSYELVAELGRGGMGAVSRARHAETGGEHAVKILITNRSDPHRASRASARFKREAEILARMDAHPGLVRIHAWGIEPGGIPWYAMDVIEGVSLADRVRAGPLPPREAATLLAAVARAVEHVHGQGVLHRDLKPQNILIDAAGQTRIVDFGIARDEQADRDLTMTGEMTGTPAFMAPEQVEPGSRSGSGSRESSRIGPWTDVYGLGAVLYATLTGRPPFGGDGMAQLMIAICERPPEAPRARVSAIPVELDAVCLRALEKKPEERYASAGALADDLERWLRGEPVTASRSNAKRIVRRIGQLDRKLLVAGALLAVAGVVALAAIGRSLGARRAGSGEVAPTRASFDDAFARSLEGDLDALAEAERRLEELPDGGREAVPADRRSLVEGLAALSRGDEVTIRRLRIEAEPWRSHLGAVIEVLVASNRPRALARLVERSPRLVADERSRGALLRALAEGRIEVGAALAEALLHAIDRELTASSGAGSDAARALGELEVGLLTRRLEGLLREPQIVETDLDDVIRRFLPHLRQLPARMRLSTEATERLAEYATDAWDTGFEDGLRLGRLLEATFSLLPAGDDRVGPLVEGLQARALGGQGKGGEESAWGLLLHRFGLWPFELHDLGALVGEDDMIEEKAEAELRLGPRLFDPGELLPLVAILIHRDAIAGEESDASRFDAHAAAIIGRWPFVLAILERHRRHGDVPGWALGWIAQKVSEARSRNNIAIGDRPIRSASPGAKLVGLLRAALELPSAPADDLALVEAVDHLFEEALTLNASTEERRRHLAVQLAWGRWLAELTGRARDPRALEAARTALVRVPAKEDRDVLWASQADRIRKIAHIAWQIGLVLIADDRGEEGCAAEATIDELVAEIGRVRFGVDASELAALHHLRHGRADEGIELLRAGRAANPDDDPKWRTYLLGAEMLVMRGERAGAARVLAVVDVDELGNDDTRRLRRIERAIGD